MLIPTNDVNMGVELRRLDLLTSASITAPAFPLLPSAAAGIGADAGEPSTGTDESTSDGALIMYKDDIPLGFPFFSVDSSQCS